MALARWKDLCVDVADPAAVAAFWAPLLGLQSRPHTRPGVTRLAGEPPTRTVWLNEVPEPRTVKNRVHLDLRVELEVVLAAGATVLRSPDEEISWHLCADPQGNELCVFAPAADQRSGLFELVVDAADPEAQAAWWAGVLGATAPGGGGRPWRWVEDLSATPFDYLVFNPVPEPKTVKNRWHWDVDCDDVEELVGRGATVLRHPDDDIGWHVLADPEGNEFCAFGSD